MLVDTAHFILVSNASFCGKGKAFWRMSNQKREKVNNAMSNQIEVIGFSEFIFTFKMNADFILTLHMHK